MKLEDILTGIDQLETQADMDAVQNCWRFRSARLQEIALGTDGKLTDEEQKLLGEKNKIGAVLLVRQRTGCGLAEAKKFVERLQ